MNQTPQTSTEQCVEIEIYRSSALLQLIRPDTKNTLSVATLGELGNIFSGLESNRDIETIIVTGSGDTFASGANLNELRMTSKSDAREFALRGQNLLQRIYRSSKTTIAAINGYCMGGGLDLALSCSKRIASQSAVFAHPGASLGIMTGWGGTQLLPRLVGEAVALEIFFTAKRIGAREALRIGLIDEISEDLQARIAQITGKQI